jgi:hypothetical protein
MGTLCRDQIGEPAVFVPKMSALMPRWVRTLALALPLASLALSGACNSELQGHADVLMEALGSSDYAKFQTVASPELLTDVSEQKFVGIASTYGELGEMQDKTRSGVGINNGNRSVTYQLDFVNGEVQLVVVSHSEKLDGFEFEGAGWKRAAINRHREGLERLLAAARASDRAAVRALVHPSIPDDQLDGLLAQLAPLGTHQMVHVQDDAIPEFRVEFADKKLIASVRLSGPQIIGYSFRPS